MEPTQSDPSRTRNGGTMTQFLKRTFIWCYGVVVGDGGSGRVPALTEQFFRTLKAKSMIATIEGAEQAKPLLAELRREFAEREADDEIQWPWSDKTPDQWLLLYAIEQLQIFEFDEETLNLELGQRIAESKSNLKEGVHERHLKLVAALKTEGCTPKKKRSVLHQIVNDLQWFYVQRELRANFRRTAIVNGMRWLMLALAMFIWIPVVSTNLDYQHFLAAAAAGFFGAAFSLNSGRRERMAKETFQDLKMMRFARFEGARLAFGTGAAVILLCILQAGLLAGDLFPTFTRGRISEARVAEVIASQLGERVHVGKVPSADGQAEAGGGKEDGSDESKENPNGATTEQDKAAKENAANEKDADAKDEDAKAVAKLMADHTAPTKHIVAALNADDEQLVGIIGELLREYFDELEAQGLKSNGVLSIESLRELIGYHIRDLVHETDPELDTRNLALLLVWCFLAGFFEKLVPKVLSTLQKRMEGEEEPPKPGPPVPPTPPVPPVPPVQPVPPVPPVAPAPPAPPTPPTPPVPPGAADAADGGFREIDEADPLAGGGQTP